MRRVRNAEQFAEARKRLGMTKVNIATIMQLPRPQATGYATVYRWETGESRVPGPALVLMEALLAGWRPFNWKVK